MKHSWKFLFAAIIGLGLLVMNPGDAYAKRLGGGKSFGGRPSYSQPYRPAPEYGAAPRSAPSAMPSPMQRNQAMRDSFRSRGGLMGMLGGLALGGLLGSMLFGGAFEHINFLDILIFGVIAYLGFRLLAARRGAPQWDTGRAPVDGDTRFERSGPTARGRSPHGAAPAGFDTDVMFRGGRGGASSADASDLPAGFDQTAFIGGAKQAYRHLQQAWDSRDFGELRALTTDHVYAELEAQLRESEARDHTEVLALEAKLLGAERAEGRSLASVLFTARVREAAGNAPSIVREVWHFTRRDDSPQPTWYLDGLQQVDE